MRIYSNNAVGTTLQGGGVDAAATTLTVGDTTGWPAPTGDEVAVAAIDHGSPATVEIVTYTGKTSDTLTGVTRGIDGTTARAHAEGVQVRHVASAKDVEDPQAGDAIAQHVEDSHAPLDDDEVASGTEGSLTVTVPDNVTAVRLTAVLRSDGEGASVGARIKLNSVNSPNAYRQVRKRWSGSSAPTVTFAAEDDNFGMDTVVPASSTSSDEFGSLDMLIPDVRDAGGRARVMWRAGMIEASSASASVVTEGDGRVIGAKPVTSITIECGGGASFVAGSRIELRRA